MAALSHELLWTRRLTDVLGAGYDATAAVFGCFFFGLAFGSAAATRLTAAARPRAATGPARQAAARRPWRGTGRGLWLAVGLVEFGIGLTTLPALTLTDWTGWIWPALGTAGLGSWLGSLAKLILAVLVVVPPSFLMGMTLPLLVAAVVEREGGLGRQGVWLYAANTLGGVLGLLVTAGLTLQWLGVAGAMSWAIAVNLLVAVGCLLTYQRLDRRRPDTAGLSAEGLAATSSAAVGNVPLESAAPRTLFATALVSFASGLGVLALEILALQLVFNVWPACLYGTTAVLATVIVILAIASWATPLLVSRFGPAERLLPGVVALAAVATVAAPILFVRVTNNMAHPADTRGVISFVAVVAAHVLATFGPGLMLAGLVLPLTFSWHGSGSGDRRGRRLGWLLAANGLGGLTGATAANRLLLPWLGLHNGFSAIALLYALLAVGLSWTVGGSKSRAAALVAVVLTAGLGVFSVRFLPLMTPGPGFRIVDIRCGREGVVAVVQQVAPEEELTWRRSIVQSNQFRLASVGAEHSQRRKMLLPLLLHAAPGRVATIGLATGITAGAALDCQAVQSLAAVEISPLIAAAAARHFADANRHIFEDRRARVAVEDGRTYLAAAPATYDVVVGDLFRPWASGVGRLYSREHFQAARRALRPGGLFCQWLPMYQLEEEQFEVILATFLRVFPRVDLWRGSFRSTVPAVGLVGLRDGCIDWAGLAERCRRLRRSGLVRDPSLRRIEGVAMYYFGQLTAADAAAPVINTLNNAWIEIDAGRSRVSLAGGGAYVGEERWVRFEGALRGRLRPDPAAPAELSRWSALGQRICGLHLAQRRGARIAGRLGEEINRLLPADFYEDVEADWEAWPVPHAP